MKKKSEASILDGALTLLRLTLEDIQREVEVDIPVIRYLKAKEQTPRKEND